MVCPHKDSANRCSRYGAYAAVNLSVDGVGRCMGWAGCAAYEQWKRDQDMLDTTKPEDVPVDAATARKQRPVYSGVLKYFPKALMEVAHCSWLGNEQHNPGSALHWDRSKSGDELDALVRHLMEADSVDTDGVLHAAKVAWRALAYLEKLLEQQTEEQA